MVQPSSRTLLTLGAVLTLGLAVLVLSDTMNARSIATAEAQRSLATTANIIAAHARRTLSDAAVMERYFSSSRFPPGGFNFPNWKDDQFDAALKALAETKDQKVIDAQTQIAHERLVDNPPWLYVVHDLNPRAMSKSVKGFVSPQSWFVDLTRVSVQ